MLYIVDDIQSRDTSLALYRYVCHHVVGTEQTVQTRRLFNTIIDNVVHAELYYQKTSGSSGEGLDMKGSDLDIMIVFKYVNVYENVNTASLNSAETCVAIEMDDSKIGFSHLRLIHCNNESISKMCTDIGNDLYLSNQLCKSHIMNKLADVVHGPCLSDKYGYWI